MLYKEETNLGIKLGQCGKFIKKDISLSENDRFKHEYIIGHDGYGKETFILNQAIQDIENGNGFCFIDQYGDFVEELLKYIPKERAEDVIYFNVADKERPIGLNIFDIDNTDEIEFVVNETTDMFISMFGPEIFGPRIVEYFKYSSMAILEDFEDKPIIFDSIRMFTDDSYRKYKMEKVTNPIVLSRWEKTYNAMGDREKAEIIPYFSSKFVQFQTNPHTRNIIGQTKSGFNMDEVINNKKILLVNLNKGEIGDADSNLIGKILLFKINLALKKRAIMNKDEISPFFLYLDNFPSYILGQEYENFLNNATRCNLGIIMSHQYGDQLKSESYFQKVSDMSQMILNTVKTLCIFKVGTSDSERLEKETYPKFTKDNLKNLEPMQGIIRIGLEFTQFNIEEKLGKQNDKIPSILKEYSSKKYGRRMEFIEAENRLRLGLGIEDNDSSKNDVAQEKNRYNIPKTMQENDPDLIGLILGSTHYTTEQKQKWFDFYPFMNEEQKGKLKHVLMEEKTLYGNDGETKNMD